jgi:hypothetical protein
MTDDTSSSISDGAATLARQGARKGGIARAQRLSPEERSEISRRAAAARWGHVHVAYHTGVMQIGDISISAAVLEDQTRLLSQTTVLTALGRNPQKSRRSRGDSDDLRAPFLVANNLQPFISDELRDLIDPIAFRVAGEGSAKSWGYRAEMLPLVCWVYLDAQAAGKLNPKQEAVAKAAGILARGLARVGIIALVDEATGYQEVRARDELTRILEHYVQAEFRPWIKTFPDEFFQEIYRLQGWEYKPGTSKRTPYVGKLVNKYVYNQLPEGVLDELRRLNPRTDKGYRARKHHQFLTDGTGNVHLDKQIVSTLTLMRAAESKQQFEDLFERVHPSVQPRLPLFVDVPPDEHYLSP